MEYTLPVNKIVENLLEKWGLQYFLYTGILLSNSESIAIFSCVIQHNSYARARGSFYLSTRRPASPAVPIGETNGRFAGRLAAFGRSPAGRRRRSDPGPPLGAHTTDGSPRLAARDGFFNGTDTASKQLPLSKSQRGLSSRGNWHPLLGTRSAL